MNAVVKYFEIPVHDMDRAVAFYESVFRFTLERGEIDGNLMAFFPTDPASTGAGGALAMGDSYVPGKQGCRLYFTVDNIDTTLARAIAAGGAVLYPKTAIGELGFVAEFKDSEGNCIALHSTKG
jgi:predicted enzyme related to lactoylglutathione lyase